MARVTAFTGRKEASCPRILTIVPPIPEALAPNTDRAYAGDLAYYQGWCKAALGRPLSYPVSTADILRFIDDHTGGMTPEVEASLMENGIKGRLGSHAVATVRRRVFALGRLHRLRGLANPGDDLAVKQALRRAGRQAARSPDPRHKPITRAILEAMLETCDDTLRGRRDRALLLVAFASGGRRRSEVAALEYSGLIQVPDGFLLRIHRSKTDQQGKGFEVPVLGTPARALNRWLEASGIRAGRLFRSIKPDGSLARVLSDRGIARVVKHRIGLAGFNPADYSAHSLRSGFITEAGRQRIALGDAMALSGHRTVGVALRYYRAGDVLANPAAHLLS